VRHAALFCGPVQSHFFFSRVVFFCCDCVRVFVFDLQGPPTITYFPLPLSSSPPLPPPPPRNVSLVQRAAPVCSNSVCVLLRCNLYFKKRVKT
jgi:hypothetical protein